MTQEEFNGMPLLLSRAELVRCGLPEGAIDGLRFEVKPGSAAPPEGKVGWVAFNGSRQGKYRKQDVAALIGLRMR